MYADQKPQRRSDVTRDQRGLEPAAGEPNEQRHDGPPRPAWATAVLSRVSLVSALLVALSVCVGYWSGTPDEVAAQSGTADPSCIRLKFDGEGPGIACAKQAMFTGLGSPECSGIGPKFRIKAQVRFCPTTDAAFLRVSVPGQPPDIEAIVAGSSNHYYSGDCMTLAPSAVTFELLDEDMDPLDPEAPGGIQCVQLVSTCCQDGCEPQNNCDAPTDPVCEGCDEDDVLQFDVSYMPAEDSADLVWPSAAGFDVPVEYVLTYRECDTSNDYEVTLDVSNNGAVTTNFRDLQLPGGHPLADLAVLTSTQEQDEGECDSANGPVSGACFMSVRHAMQIAGRAQHAVSGALYDFVEIKHRVQQSQLDDEPAPEPQDWSADCEAPTVRNFVPGAQPWEIVPVSLFAPRAGGAGPCELDHGKCYRVLYDPCDGNCEDSDLFELTTDVLPYRMVSGDTEPEPEALMWLADPDQPGVPHVPMTYEAEFAPNCPNGEAARSYRLVVDALGSQTATLLDSEGDWNAIALDDSPLRLKVFDPEAPNPIHAKEREDTKCGDGEAPDPIDAAAEGCFASSKQVLEISALWYDDVTEDPIDFVEITTKVGMPSEDPIEERLSDEIPAVARYDDQCMVGIVGTLPGEKAGLYKRQVPADKLDELKSTEYLRFHYVDPELNQTENTLTASQLAGEETDPPCSGEADQCFDIRFTEYERGPLFVAPLLEKIDDCKKQSLTRCKDAVGLGLADIPIGRANSVFYRLPSGSRHAWRLQFEGEWDDGTREALWLEFADNGTKGTHWEDNVFVERVEFNNPTNSMPPGAPCLSGFDTTYLAHVWYKSLVVNAELLNKRYQIDLGATIDSGILAHYDTDNAAPNEICNNTAQVAFCPLKWRNLSNSEYPATSPWLYPASGTGIYDGSGIEEVELYVKFYDPVCEPEKFDEVPSGVGPGCSAPMPNPASHPDIWAYFTQDGDLYGAKAPMSFSTVQEAVEWVERYADNGLPSGAVILGSGTFSGPVRVGKPNPASTGHYSVKIIGKGDSTVINHSGAGGVIGSIGYDDAGIQHLKLDGGPTTMGFGSRNSTDGFMKGDRSTHCHITVDSGMLFGVRYQGQGNTFSDFNILEPAQPSGGSPIEGSGMHLQSSDSNVLSRITVQDPDRWGILFTEVAGGTSDGNVVSNCDVTSAYSGIDLRGNGNTIVDNEVSESESGGILVYGSENDIAGNTLTENGVSAIVVSPLPGVNAINNLIGALRTGGGIPFVPRNNKLVNNPNRGLWFQAGADNNNEITTCGIHAGTPWWQDDGVGNSVTTMTLSPCPPSP